jgi:hypothetical protein
MHENAYILVAQGRQAANNHCACKKYTSRNAAHTENVLQTKNNNLVKGCDMHVHDDVLVYWKMHTCQLEGLHRLHRIPVQLT